MTEALAKDEAGHPHLSFPSPVSAGGEGDMTWLKDDEEIDGNAEVKVVDETSTKLIIKKATMQDAGKYTCQCDFNNGHSDNIMTELYIYGM